MNKQSFTKLEHELIHAYRNRLNLAESESDVHNIFSRTILELLLAVFNNQLQIKAEDIEFSPGASPAFTLEKSLFNDEKLQKVWSSSDLPQIVQRLAENAEHRYRYLQTHREKTRSKIGRH